MKTWTATSTTTASPDAIMAMLTDPDAARRWAPVPFEVEQMDSDRLEAGARARVAGSLGGISVGFDLDVAEATGRRLALSADGPTGFDVAYELEGSEEGSSIAATVAVRGGRGLSGRLLAKATEALLVGGALDAALERITREALSDNPLH
jgi:hypothetical protein